MRTKENVNVHVYMKEQVRLEIYLSSFYGAEFLKKKSLHIHCTGWIPNTWNRYALVIHYETEKVGIGFQLRK